MKLKQQAFVDADFGLFTAALSAEEPIQWSESLWTLHSEQVDAERSFAEWLTTLSKNLAIPVDDMVICLSSKDSRYWRHRIIPTYKANRKGGRKPICFGGLRDWVMANYDTILYTGMEADDVLGIKAGEGLLVSNDKDLHTVPGDHFNPTKPELGVLTIDQHVADFNHMIQALAGDSTDGYGGCPSYGPVKSRKLLAPMMGNLAEMWDSVLIAYEDKGLSADVALRTAQVAYIMRPGDFDEATGDVTLWTPPE